jgi:L-iditol 2-dehydrogenase
VFVIPKTMRAVVYHGVNDLRLETVPVPRIGRNELLVKVAVCGVCPTDIKKIQHGTVPPPRIFGHETAGTIVKLGGGASVPASRLLNQFKVGDRVALHHHVPCLDCHFCRHHAFAQCETYKRTGITAGFEPAGGGYAEYVRVMPFVLPGVVKIPAKNSFEEGAMLEPVNTVLKAVRRLNLLRGDTVLVAGQGRIGLMFTRLLQLAGARVLATDLLESRLKLARKFGAQWTQLVGSARCADRTPQRGVPTALDPLSRNAAVNPQLDLSSICLDEKDLIGSYSSDFTLQDEVARLVFSRRLDVRPLISHYFPLTETANAVTLAAQPTPDSLKILVSADDQ